LCPLKGRSLWRGSQIVAAWQEWLNSEDGRKAANPETLGTSLSARQYLENRLNSAFQAGIRAAENAQHADAKRA